MTEEPEDDELLVPSPEEQRWIADRLRELVERRGYEHLVLAPLVEPTETYFPDPWRGGAVSLRRLCQRLMIYADLEEIAVHVKVYAEDEVGGPLTPAGIGAPAWLVRKDDAGVHVAARETAMRDPMLLVPALARVVSEAWRATHGLSHRDAVIEQRLTDVTSIYLGFGLLTTDASIRHSAERAGGFRLNRKKSRLGVLPTQLFAFGIAMQLEARKLSLKERKRIAGKLQSNQAGFIMAATRIVQRDPSFCDPLQIPAQQTWSPAPVLEDLTAPLGDNDGADEASPGASMEEKRLDLDQGVTGMNDGKPVFRVQRSKALRLAKMLALPTVMVGMLAGRMNMGIEIEMWKVALVAAGLGLLGLGVGRLLPDSRCSEPKCGEVLDDQMKVCPRCGGTIAGVIGHPKERLAAEDALERAES